MIRFTNHQIDALADVARAWKDKPFTLIGASALHHHIALSWRQTQDLDLTVAIELDELDTSIALLDGWRRDARLEHQWRSPRGVKVDIVPAGPSLLASGTLVWPTSGFRMNLAGLDLALAHWVPLELPGGTVIRVAALPAIVVLKMASWLDRPGDRDRDLSDLAHLLDEFLDAGDERRYDDHVLAQGLGYDEVGPYVLGRELATIATPSHRRLIERFLARVGDPNDAPHAQMLRLGPASWRRDRDDDDEALGLRLAALLRGFTAAP